MSLGFLSKPLSVDYLKAVETDAYLHTQRLRAMAQRAGWPTEAVNGLHIEIVDGKYVPTVDPEVKDLVEDLSYGKGTEGRPSPVILNFMRTLGEVAI
jgi:hypothetical protein